LYASILGRVEAQKRKSAHKHNKKHTIYTKNTQIFAFEAATNAEMVLKTPIRGYAKNAETFRNNEI